MKSNPHASVMTVPPAIATGTIIPKYQLCHVFANPATKKPPPYTNDARKITRAIPNRSPSRPAKTAAIT